MFSLPESIRAFWYYQALREPSALRLYFVSDYRGKTRYNICVSAALDFENDNDFYLLWAGDLRRCE
jgi:hypothetical protein